MNISDKGMTFIALEETGHDLSNLAKTGCLHAYQDQVGIWTIGIGHTGKEVHEGLVWTPEQVKAGFLSDLKRFIDCINYYVTFPLVQCQFDALVSFTFNIGCHAFETSTLLNYLRNKDFVGVGQQFLRWTKGANGLTLPVLVGRRSRENRLFQTGDYGF